MPCEIERKFLVAGDYKALASSASRVAQGYICTEHGRTVRVRLRGERGYLTIKGPSADGGLSRYEWEKELPDFPPFLGREVTGDARFYNSSLTLRPFSAWPEEERAALLPGAR